MRPRVIFNEEEGRISKSRSRFPPEGIGAIEGGYYANRLKGSKVTCWLIEHKEMVVSLPSGYPTKRRLGNQSGRSFESRRMIHLLARGDLIQRSSRRNINDPVRRSTLEALGRWSMGSGGPDRKRKGGIRFS